MEEGTLVPQRDYKFDGVNWDLWMEVVPKLTGVFDRWRLLSKREQK